MSGVVKKKLCWNCDASVPLDSETCLYCGVGVTSAISEEDEEPKVAMPPPLYGKLPGRGALAAQAPSNPPQNHVKEPQIAVNKKRVIPPQTGVRPKPPVMKLREEASTDIPQEALSIQRQPNTMLSLFLLLGGSTFFLFGLVILLFSDQGALILRWNRDQALIYLGLGCVFLLAGWRFILRIEE